MLSSPVLLLVVLDGFFLAGVTVNNLESGGMILIERATLSLFLKLKVTVTKFIQTIE